MGSEEFLKEAGITKEVQTAKEVEKQVIEFSDAIKKKREELELKKLEIELSKLEQPDTRVDYYDKMLQLQKENFEKLLEMQEKHGDLRLEIEKLKLEDVGEDSEFLQIFEMIQPYLKNINPQKSEWAETPIPQAPIHQVAQDNIMEQKKQEEFKQFEEYKKQVKDGTLKEPMAWKMFSLSRSEDAKKLGREKFKEEFNKIKNG